MFPILSLNPYESPQTTEPSPLVNARAKWERVRNTSYDGTPFPTTISFRGKYRIRDFHTLIQKLHRSSVIGWYIFVAIWLGVTVLAFWKILLEPTGPTEKLIMSSVVSLFFGLPSLLTVLRLRRWHNDQARSNSFQGQIGPDGISLAEMSNQKATGIISATEFLPWTELHTIEEIPPDGRVIVGLTSQENRTGLPLPTRVMLVATSDKDPAASKKQKDRNDFQYFYEIICLDPTFFQNEQEWQMLTNFLRVHLKR